MPTNHKPQGWIGVDFDGTLVEYHHERDANHVGKPIPQMVQRGRRWLAEGMNVKIFTSRLNSHKLINNFCLDYFGRKLPITNVKDPTMIQLWDDRAVSVETNTGKRRCSCHTPL